MELEQAILERRSVRKFTAEPIPHETMEQIVRLASYAPSWKNTQTVRYTVVEDRALLDRVAEECVLGFTFNARTIHRCTAWRCRAWSRASAAMSRTAATAPARRTAGRCMTRASPPRPSAWPPTDWA